MQRITQFVLKLSVFAIMFSISIFSHKIYALEDNINKKDFFPIGVYYIIGQKPIQSETDDPNDPSYIPLDGDFRYNPEIAENEYFKEFQDLKSYGFNTTIMMINPIVHPAADEERANNIINGLIRAAENASMQIVVPMNQTTSLLSAKHENLSEDDINNALSLDYIDLFIASSATFGYQIFDEPVPYGYAGTYGPSYKEVREEQLGQVQTTITTLDSNAYALSTWNNINSMELLNIGMNPDALLMDLYPLALDAYNGDQSDGDTPLGDLSDANPRGREDDGSFNLGLDQPTYTKSILQAQNIIGDKPVWVAFQAFGGASFWRSPEPKELRLQTFVAIKNGAKGIFYFMYQSESWASGMMDINYQETPLILEAKAINEKVNVLAPTLLKLNLTQNHATSNEAEVQTFTHENGEKYLIAVNKDVSNTSTVTVLIDKSWLTNNDNALDIYTDEDLIITEFDENYLKLVLPIEAADGRVILLKSHFIPTTSISTTKTEYTSNEKITVSFSSMDGNQDGDWLAIFPKDAPSAGEFIVDAENDGGWIFTGGENSGEITFDSLNLADLPAGEYEIRAFFNDSYDLEASYSFSILDDGGTSITTNKTVYIPHEKITVSFSNMQGNEEGDWLAIFPKNAPSAGEFIVDAENDTGWIFTGGENSGEITFDSLDLATLPASKYEVRAFFNDSYNLEASYAFSIQADVTTDKTVYTANDKITATFSSMEGNEEGDWLAIFPKDAPSAGEFIVDAENDGGWIFTGGSNSGEVTFESLDLATLPAGEYEIRAFFNDSYTLEASNTFYIVADTSTSPTSIFTDKTVYTGDEKITVNFSSMQGNPDGDWLAIFPKNAPSAGEFIVDAENDTGWIFTGGEKVGEVTFDSLNLADLPIGDYEVRAFFNDSYSLEASYSFTITSN